VAIEVAEAWERAFTLAIAANLDSYMRTADIATAELAAALNVNPSAVYQWLSGRERPSLRRLITIALALRCPLATLLSPELLGAAPPSQPTQSETSP
jgi:transcriptional regulator with XRE-family HTH domain